MTATQERLIAALNAVLILALCATALVGCAAQQQAQIPAQLQQGCAAAAPFLNAATSPAVPASVSQVAVYGAAFCNQINAGTLPVTANANSAPWLGQVLQGAQTAAQIAGVVLPLIAAF